ncbi:MAG: hypothetical protein CVT82_08465 [Alphaproteobacteria bacterium HGW-Alphaproteobacteria-4]|nr:MAG: hypothetical protein CVT82_08465 [Alphaproteobacteria bacterium HGW-Alphaproteobacteria-4]
MTHRRTPALRLAVLALFALALALAGLGHRLPSADEAAQAVAISIFPGGQICTDGPAAPAKDGRVPFCAFCQIAGAAHLPGLPAQPLRHAALARRNRPPLHRAARPGARRGLRPAPRAPPAPRELV